MKAILLILTLAISFCGNAQNKTKKQEDNLVKTYPLKNIKTISIKNNNKNFILKTWKENNVKMSTYITTEDNKSLDAYHFNTKQRGETFKIEVEVSSDGEGAASGTTTSTTSAGNNLTNVAAGKKNKKVNVSSNDNITYSSSSNGNYYSYNTCCNCPNGGDITITVPENIELEIENNYGNIEIEDGLNKLTLDSKGGNVNAQNINQLVLESSYSNFEFGNIENAEMDVNGCNFTMGEINTLDLDTKFSNYEIEKTDNVNLQSSQSDNFDITDLGSIKGSFSFSTFKVQKLNKQLDLNANSGSIKVKNVAASVTKISIEGKYSDVDLNAKNLPAYNLVAKTIFSTIRSNGKSWESSNKEEEFNDAKGNGGKATILVNCNSCTVTIK